MPAGYHIWRLHAQFRKHDECNVSSKFSVPVSFALETSAVTYTHFQMDQCRAVSFQCVSVFQGEGWLTVVQRLATEKAQAVEVEDGESKEQVLVEEEQDHAGDASIGPAAMHQQQRLQETELGDAEVAAHHSLHALLTTDAYPCITHNFMGFETRLWVLVLVIGLLCP